MSIYKYQDSTHCVVFTCRLNLDRNDFNHVCTKCACMYMWGQCSNPNQFVNAFKLCKLQEDAAWNHSTWISFNLQPTPLSFHCCFKNWFFKNLIYHYDNLKWSHIDSFSVLLRIQSQQSSLKPLSLLLAFSFFLFFFLFFFFCSCVFVTFLSLKIQAFVYLQELFDLERWGQLVMQFRRENFQLHQLNDQSALAVTLQAGLSALKTPYLLYLGFMEE